VSFTVTQSSDTHVYTLSLHDALPIYEQWQSLDVPTGETYAWDPKSTYVKTPPYFAGMTMEPPGIPAITGARALAMLGDSITTDHISPAGNIPASSPAGAWLLEHGVEKKDFNSYGA